MRSYAKEGREMLNMLNVSDQPPVLCGAHTAKEEAQT